MYWRGLFPHCFLVVYTGYECSDEAAIFLHFITMFTATKHFPFSEIGKIDFTTAKHECKQAAEGCGEPSTKSK